MKDLLNCQIRTLLKYCQTKSVNDVVLSVSVVQKDSSKTRQGQETHVSSWWFIGSERETWTGRRICMYSYTFTV